MAGNGTGYPLSFECYRARRIYYGTRSSRGEDVARTVAERAEHVVKLTGKTFPTPREGKHHSRKSWTTFEYVCSCGWTGTSAHIDLERMARAEGIEVPWT